MEIAAVVKIVCVVSKLGSYAYKAIKKKRTKKKGKNEKEPGKKNGKQKKSGVSPPSELSDEEEVIVETYHPSSDGRLGVPDTVRVVRGRSPFRNEVVRRECSDQLRRNNSVRHISSMNQHQRSSSQRGRYPTMTRQMSFQGSHPQMSLYGNQHEIPFQGSQQQIPFQGSQQQIPFQGSQQQMAFYENQPQMAFHGSHQQMAFNEQQFDNLFVEPSIDSCVGRSTSRQNISRQASIGFPTPNIRRYQSSGDFIGHGRSEICSPATKRNKKKKKPQYSTLDRTPKPLRLKDDDWITQHKNKKREKLSIPPQQKQIQL